MQPHDTTTQVCTKCGRELPLTSEYWHSGVTTTTGFRRSCKDCYNKQKYEWRRRNQDKHHQYTKGWDKRNPEKAEIHRKNHQHRYRARKLNATGEHTQDDILRIHEEQEGRCAYCQAPLDDYHVDHVVPLTQGGSDWPSNLVVACPKCNMSKNDKLPWEWTDRWYE